MENKMADKTVTTCASVLYALFKKRKNRVEVPPGKQRKCSCLCHTYDNKDNSNNEMNDNKFFHCKCNHDCQLAKQKCKSCGRTNKKKNKLKKKKIVKFQIEHTGSLNNLAKQGKSLSCSCELRSPSLYKMLTVKQPLRFHQQQIYSPKYSPGKFSLQEIKSPGKPAIFCGSAGYSHPKQLPSSNVTGKEEQRPKSLYEWCIPFNNLEVGEKESESPKGPVFRGRWHGDVMIYMRSYKTQKELEMFHDEISLLGLIRHENVVLFMGASCEPPNLAVVTSVRKGQTLFTHLHLKQTSFHFGSKFSIAKQIAQGMGYLHAKGITLEKLCSRNIFLEAKVKIGITEYTMINKPIVKEGYAYIPAGHLSYFSPEQMRTLRHSGTYLCTNDKTTQKSDVYAYGTLMHEIFLGRYPFKESINAQTLVWKVSRGHVATVDANDFPLMFKDLMQSCWQPSPENRPEFQDIISTMRKLNIPRSLQKKLSLSDSGAINKDQNPHFSSFRIHNSPSQQQRWRKHDQ